MSVDLREKTLVSGRKTYGIDVVTCTWEEKGFAELSPIIDTRT